jgi:hypothetical protein
LRVGEVLLESVELPLPELAVVSDPFGCALHRLGSESASVHASVLVAHDQAGAFEDAQMFRDGGKGHVVRRGEIADGRFTESELREDAAARGVGEGAKGGVESRD